MNLLNYASLLVPPSCSTRVVRNGTAQNRVDRILHFPSQNKERGHNIPSQEEVNTCMVNQVCGCMQRAESKLRDLYSATVAMLGMDKGLVIFKTKYVCNPSQLAGCLYTSYTEELM